MNVLKPNEITALLVLLRTGSTYREIERKLGIRRETIAGYAREHGLSRSKPATRKGVATGSELKTGQNPPPRPPGGGESIAGKIPKSAVSACQPYREWIEAQVLLGRNAMSIYQDLVEQHGFAHKYNSVKRFCRCLKAREPDRFDILEFDPGEEAQVDFGQGAPTLHPGTGKYKKPNLFVMTLRYSRKSFRKTVWKVDEQTWARLHEEAFRYFGGCVQYVVLDNLKQGVIKPDIYEPALNPVYSTMLAHYQVVADPARVGDPNRKGSVENAIGHTQSTALKGRKFESIEAQNEWLMHWEERWAAPRVHGRTKRQVLEMFLEEKPFLKPLPASWFRYFEQGVRTVDDAGLVQVKGSYYAALPAAPGDDVMVRIFDEDIEVYDLSGLLLKRHRKTARKGLYRIAEEDRLFNPSRETARLIARAARIGPSCAEFCREIFKKQGRVGQRVMYGIVNQTRHYKREDIEGVCRFALDKGIVSYKVLKSILEKRSTPAVGPVLKQVDPIIRPLTEYQTFWEINSQSNTEGGNNDDVYH